MVMFSLVAIMTPPPPPSSRSLRISPLYPQGRNSEELTDESIFVSVIRMTSGSVPIVLLFFICTLIRIVNLCHVVAMHMFSYCKIDSTVQNASSYGDIFVKLRIVEYLSINGREVKGQWRSTCRRGSCIDSGATSRWNRCRAWHGPVAGALQVPDGDIRWPSLPLSTWIFVPTTLNTVLFNCCCC